MSILGNQTGRQILTRIGTDVGSVCLSLWLHLRKLCVSINSTEASPEPRTITRQFRSHDQAELKAYDGPGSSILKPIIPLSQSNCPFNLSYRLSHLTLWVRFQISDLTATSQRAAKPLLHTRRKSSLTCRLRPAKGFTLTRLEPVRFPSLLPVSWMLRKATNEPKRTLAFTSQKAQAWRVWTQVKTQQKNSSTKTYPKPKKETYFGGS